MLSLRVSRDKRGYDYIYLMLESRRKGRTVTRLLYGGRWPAPLRIGQPPLDETTRKVLEEAHPEVVFDWGALHKTLLSALSVPREPFVPGAGSRNPRRGAPARPGGPPPIAPRSGPSGPARGGPPPRPQSGGAPRRGGDRPFDESRRSDQPHYEMPAVSEAGEPSIDEIEELAVAMHLKSSGESPEAGGADVPELAAESAFAVIIDDHRDHDHGHGDHHDRDHHDDGQHEHGHHDDRHQHDDHSHDDPQGYGQHAHDEHHTGDQRDDHDHRDSTDVVIAVQMQVVQVDIDTPTASIRATEVTSRETVVVSSREEMDDDGEEGDDDESAPGAEGAAGEAGGAAGAAGGDPNAAPRRRRRRRRGGRRHHGSVAAGERPASGDESGRAPGDVPNPPPASSGPEDE